MSSVLAISMCHQISGTASSRCAGRALLEPCAGRALLDATRSRLSACTSAWTVSPLEANEHWQWHCHRWWWWCLRIIGKSSTTNTLGRCTDDDKPPIRPLDTFRNPAVPWEALQKGRQVLLWEITFIKVLQPRRVQRHVCGQLREPHHQHLLLVVQRHPRQQHWQLTQQQ